MMRTGILSDWHPTQVDEAAQKWSTLGPLLTGKDVTLLVYAVVLLCNATDRYWKQYRQLRSVLMKRCPRLHLFSVSSCIFGAGCEGPKRH